MTKTASSPPPASSKVIALIVAGGRGSRARTTLPKQYISLGGIPLLRRTVMAFLRHPKINTVQVVIGDQDHDHYEKAVTGLDGLLPPVIGGTDRQASVKAGLESLIDKGALNVLIHDGARPFVSEDTINDVITALDQAEGAIAALPVSDTLKRQRPHGGIEATVDRDHLWRAQTPQGFRFDTILKAHRDAAPNTATDDASLLEAQGVHVALVVDKPTNIKVTYPEDFALAHQLLGSASLFRTGLGFDVHAFEPGEAVILGGISIPHTAKLKGHSDADVVLHALTDALYGAMGAGDIGQHFPPSDEKWRGAASSTFLHHATALLQTKGGSINNIDITIMCEAPKIGPHREAMVAHIATLIDLSPDQVSVKATTTEKLGFTGREEGIACQAIATVTMGGDE
ncbi:MAG: bifunctional 2-C-methyl-D-erythritol 4-phosphate cytidylyltransferase/2-C-methyl-D-erythritol 2,4-cyclodiphosphate synthase [Pseudomonadota bacterium]